MNTQLTLPGIEEAPAVEETAMTTSAKIRALAVTGKSRAEIAKILGIRYQHVRNVLITPLKRGAM
jgi:hypothetical protein